MKKYLVALAVEFVLFCVLYNLLLTRFLPAEKSWEAIIIISFLMLLPAGILNGLFYYFREISLIRHSENAQLKDGRRVALSGYVRALQDVLTSPFTGKQCVSYSYKVIRRDRGNKNTSDFVEYTGNVQVPSTLRTNLMEIRLLGLMDGDKEHYAASDELVSKNAYEYLSSRQFEPKQTLSQAWSRAKAMLTDNDGSVSEEVKVTDRDLDLSGRRLEEWCLEINKPYTIIGIWSSSQNGLLTDPFGKGAITVLQGNPSEASKAMRKKIGCSVILALFLFAFLNFLAYVFLQS